MTSSPASPSVASARLRMSARVVVVLAGSESAYLTGVTIDINGGLYMS